MFVFFNISEGWGKSGLEATLTTHSWVAMCRQANSLRGHLSPLQEMASYIVVAIIACKRERESPWNVGMGIHECF